MHEDTVRFKHVNDGHPFRTSSLPKLPPAALRIILDALSAKGLGPKVDARQPGIVELLNDLACEMVALSLRRINPAVTVDTVRDDEDYEEVVKAWRHIQRSNPAIFPTSPAAEPEAAEDADPLGGSPASDEPATR